MKSLAPSKTPNAQCYLVAILGALLFALSNQDVHAQVGNNNPSGVSGIFNGHAGGCGYDPYTANATRSITDISVAGAVSEYPLALVRTANSRAPSTTEVFGFAGGWNHNYNWILEDSPTSNTANFQPRRYTVEFPDGRVETFRAVTWDTTCYRVRPGADTPAQSTSVGVRERFVPLNTSTMLAYLILPDGGEVEFTASQHVANGHYYYKYHATAIIDPYGLRTRLVDEVVLNGARRRLVWVIEPAGRYLHFAYVTANGPKIASVTASDGRVVNYYYIYCNGCRLDHVLYYNNANWTARYQYCNANVGQGLPPLLWTANDPMYAGPMKRIAYDYKPAIPANPDGTTPVYGQILRERYWDGVVGHEASGAVVSTLTVGLPNNNPVYRTETRGDSATRTFIYNGAGPGYLAWASDFTNRYASQSYDSYKYINSVTDRNGNRTDYTNYALTGNVNVVTYPLTQGDTPGQQTRPTVRYQYGWANCPDPYNQDPNNPYYLYSITDEGNHATIFTRDANKRVYQITYADGGYERFPLYNSFNQVLTHLTMTGGTETFTYDGRGLKQTYRNPDNPSGNPTIRYYYDTKDRVNGIYDALNHPTNWTYNDRGQLLITTLPPDPFDNNQRNTITNAYNPDGTLQSRTNELGFVTTYTYDDYRRLKSATPPGRGDGTGLHTTNFYYDANGVGDDYKYTDANVTYVKLPSGKRTKTVHDSNRRKSSVTVGYGTSDAATTSYDYDNVGNIAMVTDPLNHLTATSYDERNRPSAINVTGQLTTIQYDTAGHKKKVTRPNSQEIRYDLFDNMNRVTQQTVTQNPSPDAVTTYTYYPSGLLHTMKDPHNTTETYSYTYDVMGRKWDVTYPLDSLNPPARRVESFRYDTVGRLQTFTNRNGKTQTFTYDALNRITRADWNDSTPDVTFGYDAASHLTEIDNANATIQRLYWNDNLLGAETEQILVPGGSSKTVMYFYDDDSNRGTIYYPDYMFVYSYTGRNQLKSVNAWADYEYDANGNLTKRTLNNDNYTEYVYDGLDRPTWVTHHLPNGTGRAFLYGDYDASNNPKWMKRLIVPNSAENNKGEVFRYDRADQAIGVQVDVLNPDQVQSISQTINYDGNGNRTSFFAYGPLQNYTSNNLNQYTARTNSTSPIYDKTGNMTRGFDGSAYTYDAQNRLLTAPSMSFNYDGLNRQVSRTDSQGTTFSVWDGWDLIEEYQSGGATSAVYLYGAGGLICGLTNGQLNFYYQDASGNTSLLTDTTGNLLEWYRYDLHGTPFFYDSTDHLRSPNQSAFGVGHLFTGQQWYKEVGLYDLRNRFYSPDTGRFLQPDPIGFRGDRTNLYRYCVNNPVTRWDPFGLQVPTSEENGGVTVYGNPVERGYPPGGVLGGGNPIGGGSGEPGNGDRGRSDNPSALEELERVNQELERLSNELSGPPPQNPPSPGDQSTNPATSSASPTQAQITSQVLQAVVVTFPFGGQYMPTTTIKNSAQGHALGRRKFSKVPIFVPPGENPQATVNRWAGTTYPGNLPSFGLAFNFKGPNDFAYNVSPIYDSYGNFIYGWSGTLGGIPASLLQGMGHALHGGLNNPFNVYDIELGIDAAMMGGTISVVPVSDSDF